MAEGMVMMDACAEALSLSSVSSVTYTDTTDIGTHLFIAGMQSIMDSFDTFKAQIVVMAFLRFPASIIPGIAVLCNPGVCAMGNRIGRWQHAGSSGSKAAGLENF